MKNYIYSHLLIIVLIFFCAGNKVRGVGAVTPFTSYEAESGTLGGGASIVSLTAAPTTQFSSPQLEASGHAYVQLTANGQYVQWTNTTGQNITALNLRSSIPDASGGGGTTSTIDLYVNGVLRQALSVNSVQNYCYEGTNYNGQTDKNPADGDPRDFWNDTHAFITGAAVANGSTIRLQKDSANSATSYHIDVIDVENPPAASAQPANSLSIISYGAVSNSIGTDNTAALNNCFSAAKSQGKIAWIPAGTYYFSAINGGLNATGITIAGAGPWYSTINRVTPANNTQGIANIITTVSCTISNLSLDCNANSRANNNNNGAVNSAGTNWVVDNVWIQHVTSSFWCAGVSGIARNCRTLSTWADGGNFNNVQSANGVGNNLVYSNNFVRGTGDDAMAINSVNNNGSTFYTIMSNIDYVNNTAVAPWGGKCLGLYGGVGDVATNNLLVDSGRYLGLGVMRFGVNGSDNYSAVVTGNTILRCGGNGYNQQQQGMMIGNGGDGQGVGVVANAYVASNTILDSIYDGVGFSTCTNIVFQNNTINAPALNGIAIGAGTIDLGAVWGNAVFLNNTVINLNGGQTPVLTGGGGFQVFAPVQAASYNSESSVQTESCVEGGLDVGFISNGSYTVYSNVNLTGISYFVSRVASGGSGGNIQVRLDSSTGTLIGTCAVPATGGWQTWTDANCNLSSTSGFHNIYLVFTGGAGNLFNVEWYSLTGPNTQIAASTYDSESGIQTENCAEGGLDVGFISTGSYTVYNDIEMSGVTTFAARVASDVTGGGSIAIHLGSPTGTLIGTCTVPDTGGWQTWVTETCPISATSGFQNIYLVYTAGLNIEWLSFQAGPVLNQTEADSYNSETGGIGVQTCSEGGNNIDLVSNGSYTVYNQVNLTGFSSFNARVASNGAGGNIKICLDSPTGTVIGTCVVPANTGGWQNWITVPCSITPTTGFHNIYLVYTGGAGSLFNVEWFTFNY